MTEWVYRKVFIEEFDLSFGRYVLSLSKLTYALIPLPLTHKHTCTRSACLSITHSLSLSLPHTHFSPKSDTCKTCDEFLMWHEGVASCGSGEIGSCLLHHLQQKQLQLLSWFYTVTACGRQNRNVNMLSLWLLCIVANPDLSITQIDQKFLVSGHSFLPNDRNFKSIKSEKRRRSQIFSPSELYKQVCECRKTNPFLVTEMKGGFREHQGSDILHR